jgi:hypothetical protein
MAIVVPNEVEEFVLEQLLEVENLFVKLFSNNITVDETTTIGSFTEVSGGGYSPITLDKNQWTITPGNPTEALYNLPVEFEFVSATGSPGTIYGYYVVNAANELQWGENFPGTVTPFAPIFGSSITLVVRYQAS